MATSSFPRFKLYASDGTTLVYEFVSVTNIDDFQDPTTFVEHESLRGQGSLIIEGTQAPWDLNLEFIIEGSDYADLVSQIKSLMTTITKFTKFILKVELVDGGSTEDYKVKRLSSLVFDVNGTNRKRVDKQRCNLTLRVNTWV